MPVDTKPVAKIARLIHAVDPYIGFDETSYPDDLQGWGGHEDFWTEMVEESKAMNALEVGSWKGRSAAAIATAMEKRLDDSYYDEYEGMCSRCNWSLTERDHAMGNCIGPIEPELVCVDTWLGATEFYGNFDDPTRYGSLGMQHGYPTIYYQFLANMRRRNLNKIVTPFAQTSTNALRFFWKNKVKFDLIYIDGSHEYDDVCTDLKYAWPLLRDGGIIVGDDYCEHWDGVRMAVDGFVEDEGLKMEHRQYPGEKYPSDYWIVRKP